MLKFSIVLHIDNRHLHPILGYPRAVLREPSRVINSSKQFKVQPKTNAYILSIYKITGCMYQCFHCQYSGFIADGNRIIILKVDHNYESRLRQFKISTILKSNKLKSTLKEQYLLQTTIQEYLWLVKLNCLLIVWKE